MVTDILKHMSRWMVWLIVISGVLDLFISGALIYGYYRLSDQATMITQHNQANQCWDHVLDEAVTVHQTLAEHRHLLDEAGHCARDFP